MLWLLAIASSTPTWLKPTQNGDPLGTAELKNDGVVELRLRSVQCDGMLAEAMYHYKPTDADYRRTLDWIGAIQPGETKALSARDLEPCPKKR